MSRRRRKPAGVLILRAEHRHQIEQALFLKAHHQHIIAGLDASVAELLRVGYGVDVVREEWNMDVQKGVLSRASTDTSATNDSGH